MGGRDSLNRDGTVVGFVRHPIIKPKGSRNIAYDFKKTRFGLHRLRWALPAIAAAIVLALLIPGFDGKQTVNRDGLTFAASDLARALDTQLAAEQRQGSETRILLSFEDEDGAACRAFIRTELSGIACRRDGGWHLRVQRDGVDVEANDYPQARSVDAAVMAAALEMAEGRALDAAGERAVRTRGWRAQ